MEFRIGVNGSGEQEARGSGEEGISGTGDKGRVMEWDYGDWDRVTREVGV